MHGGFLDQFEECLHFGSGENRWDFLFHLNAHERESLPISWACQSKELLECLVSDVDGGWFPELVFRDMKEVTTEVFFTGRVGFGPEEFGKLSEHAYVGLLSANPFPVNLEIMLESNSDRRLGFQVFGHDDNLSRKVDPGPFE